MTEDRKSQLRQNSPSRVKSPIGAGSQNRKRKLKEILPDIEEALNDFDWSPKSSIPKVSVSVPVKSKPLDAENLVTPPPKDPTSTAVLNRSILKSPGSKTKTKNPRDALQKRVRISTPIKFSQEIADKIQQRSKEKEAGLAPQTMTMIQTGQPSVTTVVEPSKTIATKPFPMQLVLPEKVVKEVEERGDSSKSKVTISTVSNANIMEKKRSKVVKMVQNSAKARPTKDQNGQNMKKHLATWRYYVKRNADPAEDIEKEKMYITAIGKRLEGQPAIEAARFEAKLRYSEVMQMVRLVGIKS